ncbi:cytidine deaminase [Prolixibacteraceae bacterium JC049]|nr:cytidine deaminase [Prolixibacteraceae bacterium JC049]
MKQKEVRILIYEYDSMEELVSEEKELLLKAREASLKAYNPYSGFGVGAALLLENGEIITGNNQENSAYPSGLCAERVAIFYANAQYPDVPVKKIAITARNKKGLVPYPVKPCGACRQVLLETEERYSTPMKVILDGANSIETIDNAKCLLPLSFGKDDLLDT